MGSAGVHIVVVVLLLSAISLPAIARGGRRDPSREGAAKRLFARRLSDDKELQISEEAARGYMTNSKLEKAMREFSQRCSTISRIYSIGKSVNGVPLLAIEISDNPGRDEVEPAFKFIGNVHGDEPVGRELLMLLANWLCDNQMKDPLASLIVKNMHLHILPTMNPDGFALRRRGNANNVDLNRDFPDQFYPMNDIIELRQPETRAIMNWVQEQRFIASASLHGGALVANYPWDGSQDTRKQYYACPDDNTFQYLANMYSHSHYNMSLNKEFEGGITNGASWYPIYGGMQDWNYIHGGCFELTLEISDNKWPKASELPILFEYNRKSMLILAASVIKSGIHGRIFSSSTGHALTASVTIKGIDYNVSSSKIFGNYHRMLAPSHNYEVIASAPGFQSRATKVLLEDDAMTLDFILNPNGVSGTDETDVSGIRSCSCKSKGENGITDFLPETYLKIYFIIFITFVVILIFLWRRALFKQRHSWQ